MADINSLFPSNYLKAADLQGREARAVIDTVELEELGDGETKPVLRLRGKAKGIVLNRINATTLAEAFGPETDGWAGKDVTLFTAKVLYQGRMVDGLRLRPTPGASKPATAARPAVDPELNDDLSF